MQLFLEKATLSILDTYIQFVQEVNFPSQHMNHFVVKKRHGLIIISSICSTECGEQASNIKCKHLWLTRHPAAHILLLISDSFLKFTTTLQIERDWCNLSNQKRHLFSRTGFERSTNHSIKSLNIDYMWYTIKIINCEVAIIEKRGILKLKISFHF